MILKSLTLHNFKRYSDKSFTFSDGLTGIIGKNGSGKSTIFDAILFALYGELKTKGYKETIRNMHAADNAKVSAELLFEFADAEYLITREFRGKNLAAYGKLTKNGEEIANGAKEITAQIIRLTKMSKEAFLHTLFASQKELTSLSTLKNEERKKMIRKLLGLEKIDFIESLVVEKRRELKSAVDAFRDLLLQEEEVKSYEEKISILQAQRKEKEKAQKEITEHLKNIAFQLMQDKTALEALQERKEKKESFKSQLILFESQQRSIKENREKNTQERAELREKEKELEKKRGVKEAYDALLAQLKAQNSLKEAMITKDALEKEQVSLREEYKKATGDMRLLEEAYLPFESVVEEIEKRKKQIEEEKSALLEIEREEKALIREISGENRIIDDARKKREKVEKLGKESPCPLCTRPLLEAYDEVISSLSDVIKEIQEGKLHTLYGKQKVLQEKKEKQQKKISADEATLKQKESLLEVIKSKEKDLLREKERFIGVKEKGLKNKKALEALGEIRYDHALHERLLTEEKERKNAYESYLQLQQSVTRIEVLMKEEQKLLEKSREIELKHKETEKENKALSYDAASHEKKKKAYEESQKEREGVQKESTTLSVEVATLEGEMNTLKSRLQEHAKQQKKLGEKREELLDYEKIKASLGEFKTTLNSKVSPRISDLASKMYSRITKGKYQHIEVNNDFDFFIYDEGKKYPIERFSGGEIDLANLVLRISISKTLSELSGTASVGFLAFDEVFGSQDEARRLEILEAFHMIKEEYRQIFLISHETEIKDFFEKVITC